MRKVKRTIRWSAIALCLVLFAVSVPTASALASDVQEETSAVDDGKFELFQDESGEIDLKTADREITEKSSVSMDEEGSLVDVAQSSPGGPRGV